MDKRVRGRWIFAAGILSVLFLTGCQKETASAPVSGVQVAKDGAVTGVIVEEFGMEYYTLERLAEMIDGEIAAYNAEHAGAVSLESVEMMETQPDKVVVTIHYASASDYARFNGVGFFCGTIAEAEAAGYMLPEALYSASGKGAVLSREEAAQMTDSHILIYEEDMCAAVDDKILYLSAGAYLKDQGSVQAAETGGYTYVIFK